MPSTFGVDKILDQDNTQHQPPAPDPSGRAVGLEFTAGGPDSDYEDEEGRYTAERILTDKPDPITPEGRLYKVHWKALAALRKSWETMSSFLPRCGWTISRKRRLVRMSRICWCI